MTVMTHKFDIEKIRADFPLLKRQMNAKPLVYLDSAATTQKPFCVIDRIYNFFKNEYASVHRGLYALSQDSTLECELVRNKCRKFLGAGSAEEIIFVRGATEALNLVAYGWGRRHLKAGDEILVSEVEHHANIVPWQETARATGAVLKTIRVTDEGELDLADYKKKLNAKTRVVSVTHVSNVLGSVFPVEEVVRLAKAYNALTVIDGAQAVAHLPVDVRRIGCDFYCFSGHKVYGPTGVGVLYGRRQTLEQTDPYQFGGDMIESVTFEQSTFAPVPQRFEAGTPPIVEIVGLGAALEYMERIGIEAIAAYEDELLKEATARLEALDGLRIIGKARQKTGVISFVLEGVHAHDIGTILDQEGIAIRAGHHCSQPTMKRFGVSATARISLGMYNRLEEIDVLIRALGRVKQIFKG